MRSHAVIPMVLSKQTVLSRIFYLNGAFSIAAYGFFTANCQNNIRMRSWRLGRHVCTRRTSIRKELHMLAQTPARMYRYAFFLLARRYRPQFDPACNLRAILPTWQQYKLMWSRKHLTGLIYEVPSLIFSQLHLLACSSINT